MTEYNYSSCVAIQLKWHEWVIQEIPSYITFSFKNIFYAPRMFCIAESGRINKQKAWIQNEAYWKLDHVMAKLNRKTKHNFERGINSQAYAKIFPNWYTQEQVWKRDKFTGLLEVFFLILWVMSMIGEYKSKNWRKKQPIEGVMNLQGFCWYFLKLLY